MSGDRLRLIVGVSGVELTSGEASFLREARPCGVILFSRNCATRAQIRTLVESAKAACRDDGLLILIDQEGGRVQRLRPPLGRLLPPAAAFGALYERDMRNARAAAQAVARLAAHDLKPLGVNTICAPVLDVPVAGADAVIGDRAYGRDPVQVSELGRAVADGLLDGGVLPVIKHIPGHGRATADSHFHLPVVDATAGDLTATDFAAFRPLAGYPAAMTAHVVFSAIDPERPASTSPVVTQTVIRDAIGFKGLLMSDDISMRALSRGIRRNAEAVIAAGSDLVLHCNGNLREMEEAAAGSPPLQGEPLARFDAAVAAMAGLQDCDEGACERYLAEALAVGKSAESV